MPIVRPQNLNECFLQAANFLRQKPIDLPHNVKVRIDARYIMTLPMMFIDRKFKINLVFLTVYPSSCRLRDSIEIH